MPTLPELRELERMLELGRGHLEARVACEVSAGNQRFPVYQLTLGNPDPKLPAIGFFGGIHGLERIGTQVLLYFLRGLLTRMEWDKSLHHLLQDVRLVFMPLINPGGMWQSTRCNPQGVDLMRNAPIEAAGRVPFLLGGHRISPRLPWYRGAAGAGMESENQALCRTVQEELLSRPFSIAVDCHSGFGSRDRVWFPHAHSVNPIAHLADILTLEELFQQIHPNNRYLFEPQSLQYRTHGDVWDYLYLQAQQDQEQNLFAVDAGNGFMVVGEEKSPPIVFPPGHIQSLGRASFAQGVARAYCLAGFSDARRMQPRQLAGQGSQSQPLAGTRRSALVQAMTTWVLLRGLMREARHWGEFPQLFQNCHGRATSGGAGFSRQWQLACADQRHQRRGDGKLLPHTARATGICTTLPCAGPVIGGDGRGGME